MPNSSDFNRFAVNPVNIDISRSMFNMDHSVKFSCNVGDVVPFDVIEVLPGDTFEIDTTKVVRLQPLVTPIMDEVIMDVYYFFVPNRLVWNHWINFMGENTESAWYPTTEYKIPTIAVPSGGFNIGTIADYMGIPTNTSEGQTVSALPFRAYALICDQWFRSEAIMDPVHVHVDDVNRTGVNSGDQVTDIELGGKPFVACKFFDYFTGGLPSPQRGVPVSLPVLRGSSTADIHIPVLTESRSVTGYHNHPFRVGNTSTHGVPLEFTTRVSSSNEFVAPSVSSDLDIVLGKGDGYHGGIASYAAEASPETTISNGLYPSNLWVTLGGNYFNSVTVNDLRTAFAIQKYLEKSARYGGRYIEHIKAFFNVDSPDARLQRSEYLGGSRMSLNINSVEATSSQGQPIGTVAGMSVTGDSNSDFTKSFTEDGLIIGCAVLRYHHTYQQGLDRMWFRETAYDFYNPVFANLGEQPIYLSEIFMEDAGVKHKANIFAYQERWAEYRYRPSRVAGEFRSGANTSLDMWHLGDYYDDVPYLSPEWLREDKSNLDRCLAVTSSVADQCLCDFFVKVKASRAMPLYSIPGLIDHH